MNYAPPSLLDTITDSPAHWTQTMRVSEALRRTATTLRSDAEKFAATGQPADLIDGAGCEAAAQILSALAAQIEREAP